MGKRVVRLWSDEFYGAINPLVISAGFHHAKPTWNSRPFNRLQKDYDLWYLAGGAGAVKIDSRWIEFQSGDLVTIKPGQAYQQERADRNDPFKIFFLHMLPFGQANHQFDHALSHHWPTKITTQHHSGIQPLFGELFETFTARPEGFQLRLKFLAMQILEHIFSTLKHPGIKKSLPPGHEKFLKARDYIEQQYKNTLALEQIADFSDISASYLSSLFKRYSGRSPIQYQIDCRMRTARLLLAKGVSVHEVATEVGFNSLHYFSRLFRKRTGLPPAQYALSCRRK
ncbi:MAG: helix-turn-helix transcriptional regulator [Phycisphaerae bacterium]|nr:helix-turn-helix transcriptional regulator [Phycisphaerae bacterium]